MLALSLALVAAPPPASARVAQADAQGTSEPAAPVAAPREARPAGSGLPRRAPDPMTLHEYWPVFLGFSVTWLGIVAYFLSVGRSLDRTARAMAGLDGGRDEP